MRPATITLGAACNAYVKARSDRGEITTATCRSFRETLRLVTDFFGHERALSSIRRRDIERWMGKLTCSQATVRTYLTTVRGMFRWAVIEGHAKVDPTLGIRGPKQPRRVPRGVSQEDVAEILEAAVDARERLVLLLMLKEGLRAIEVARLQMADVDFADCTMVVMGKGGHSRVLPVTGAVARALQGYLAERGRGTGALIQSRQQSYAHTDDGLTPKTVARMASRAIKRAGVVESGHSLRHTFAHRMIDAGASIRDVQSALGHVSINTTQIYLPYAALGNLRTFMEDAK